MAIAVRVLPLIAEASPRVFLDAVNSDLDRAVPLLVSMFQDVEDDPWFSTSSPHTGLLWALEGLAWSSEWMLEATLALARLDAVDPGGRLANRPLESLSSILPHWIRHTSAPLQRRVRALTLVCKRLPDTGWKLLRQIWPSDHATSSPPHSPRFRDWKPESPGVPITEAIEYIGAVVTLALDLADEAPECWATRRAPCTAAAWRSPTRPRFPRTQDPRHTRRYGPTHAVGSPA